MSPSHLLKNHFNIILLSTHKSSKQTSDSYLAVRSDICRTFWILLHPYTNMKISSLVCSCVDSFFFSARGRVITMVAPLTEKLRA
jgi:hypothetical protein